MRIKDVHIFLPKTLPHVNILKIPDNSENNPHFLLIQEKSRLKILVWFFLTVRVYFGFDKIDMDPYSY